jgi:SlyX protein
MPDTTEARLAELEIKLSFAEDLLETLNETVAAQQSQMALLHDELRAVYQHMQQMAQGEKLNLNLRDELPPHY